MIEKLQNSKDDVLFWSNCLNIYTSLVTLSNVFREIQVIFELWNALLVISSTIKLCIYKSKIQNIIIKHCLLYLCRPRSLTKTLKIQSEAWQMPRNAEKSLPNHNLVHSQIGETAWVILITKLYKCAVC